MHYRWAVTVAALVATSVSAFPLGNRGLVTSDVITSPADDLVKRDYALDVADDKKHYVRQSLLSRDAKAGDPPSHLHVPSPASKYVKRVANDDDQWVSTRVFDMNRLPAARPIDVSSLDPNAPSAEDLDWEPVSKRTLDKVT